MLLNEIMADSEFYISKEETLRDAAGQMNYLKVDTLPIVDKGRIIGILSEKDINAKKTAINGTFDIKVKDILTRDMNACIRNDDLREISQK